ncbi:MarR family transcriptional regulator [Actinomadura rupiterrae]|uniref:MarR family transcriptional regulator n=1 Tax=Actinomadura rupiterrae TaxID=559627 RepID=UPI0020A4EA14|nr:MarR family transcriptional regulator [Actinomadura rupiterrae]MCP2340265.1 DNA-binding MarR family transcriptional regulator [Actinomadura rupiterrae]
MNITELYLLGRRLQKIAEAAIPTEGVGEHPTSTSTVLAVADDLRDHPGTTVTEIAKRTGLVQSQVSNCVARLREAGTVRAEPDPSDRRRTLLHPVAEPSPRARIVRDTPIEPALAEATTNVPETLALLDRLATLLDINA